MVPLIERLYAQGGQLPDPKDHLYGLATSPKVKSLCLANCTGSGTPLWKTVLVMTEGYGGAEAFTVDITSPFHTNGVKTTTAPLDVMWHTQYMTTAATYDAALGLTTSVPAFYLAKTAAMNDFRVIFGSTYGSSGAGKYILNTSVLDGSIMDSDAAPNDPAHVCLAPIVGTPTLDRVSYGLLADVAAAKNFGSTEKGQILAAFANDTWGNMYRYTPTVGTDGYTGSSGDVARIDNLTCSHPLYYSPAVVQLDRDNPTNHAGEIYLVQVTNGPIDVDTFGNPPFPASKLVIRKERVVSGVVTSDATFGTAGGRIELAAATTSVCGVKTGPSGPCTILPADARPVGTPMAILKEDGQGFDIITLWYQTAGTSCGLGKSFLTIHEILVAGAGSVTQKFGKELAQQEPIVGGVFVGGKLAYTTKDGIIDLTADIASVVTFKAGYTFPGGTLVPDRFRRIGWTELP
jgi:hypothetical protein